MTVDRRRIWNPSVTRPPSSVTSDEGNPLDVVYSEKPPERKLMGALRAKGWMEVIHTALID